MDSGMMTTHHQLPSMWQSGAPLENEKYVSPRWAPVTKRLRVEDGSRGFRGCNAHQKPLPSCRYAVNVIVSEKLVAERHCRSFGIRQ